MTLFYDVRHIPFDPPQPEIPVPQPITRRTITPEEALRDRCAELETVIRMAIRAFNGDLAPAIAEAACRDALLP